MEIKPQELRLGNIIQREVWGEGVVTKIGPDGFVTIQPKKLMGEISCTCIELSGIELTPEWLERLGGKYSKYQGDENLTEEWSFGNGLISIVRWNFEDLWLSNSFSFKLRVKVTTVHHLQNLYFALTGEELAIDKTSLKN